MSSYAGWFQFLDTDGDGKISGPQVADFFRRSNLDDSTLREIWRQAVGNVGQMTEVQFLLAMKLVALTQGNNGQFSQSIAYPVLTGTGTPVPEVKIRGFTPEEWHRAPAKIDTAQYNINQVQSTSINAPSSHSLLQPSTPRMYPTHGQQSPGEVLRTSGQSTQIFSSTDTTSNAPIFRLDSWCTASTHQNSDGSKSAGSSSRTASCRRQEINSIDETFIHSSEAKGSQFSPCLQSFSPADLRKATNGFSKHLGGGGYGEVYKGTINHVPVAVKILGEDVMQGCKEYGREVALLGTMRHPHIVTLYGKCDKMGSLVYELLSGGNLEDRLTASALPWECRLRIAKEVALGLYYLHNCPSPIVHRDLKPANILLDGNLTAKVGDMGLSRVMDPTSRASTVAGGVKGTFHYIAPEYENTGVYTTLCDVYSFGVILLQLMTFRPANLVREEVTEALRMNKVGNVIDKRPGTGTWPDEILQTVMKLGHRCCHSQSNVRPQMAEVVESLKEMHDLSIALAASSPDSAAAELDHILRCPLTKKQLQDPVIADDGYTYERKAIQQWLNKGYRRSPLTNIPISARLISNNIAKSIIALHAKSQESRRR